VNEAEIIVDEKLPVVHIIREFDAPPAKVFRAHVDPELFVRWNWPEGFSVRFDHFDCRTGGAYRITMSGDDMEGSVHGSFHDVIPDELIVQTFSPDAAPDLVILEKHRFEDLGDGRTRLHAQSLVDSFKGRDQWLASGMETGVDEGYSKLDALIAEL
jgi:uncharacterized protein YndB with AHSA1/START domain